MGIEQKRNSNFEIHCLFHEILQKPSTGNPRISRILRQIEAILFEKPYYSGIKRF